MSSPQNDNYDYIIIGAGSAGCLLANRLSEDPGNRVCLIEAGPPDRGAAVHIPAGVVALIEDKKLNWVYQSEPEPQLNNRRIYTPRGKLLGGSSSINAMVYIRGNRCDYDHWASLGNTGWSYDELLPYFKKGEAFASGANPYHGDTGELPVVPQRSPHNLSSVFIKAATEAGYALNEDFNGATQEGVGYFHVNQVNGSRCSAAKAFLDPIKQRPNLDILTDTLVESIIIENGRALGVRIVTSQGSSSLYANAEVLLSGGVYNSPQLLMLSGVGDCQQLAALGIDTRQHLPGVGKNLQNHVDVVLGQVINTSNSYALTPKALLKAAIEVLRYLFFRKGMLTSVFSEAGGFLRSSSALSAPDIQLHFIPMLLDDHGRNTSVAKQYGYSLHVCILDPQSRGELHLREDDPSGMPLIRNNFLTAEQDMAKLVAAVKQAQQIIAAPSLAEITSATLFPSEPFNSDQDIEAFIREKANHLYHGVGTCRMGVDTEAVVTPELKVKGVQGLRVVDASIMPTIPRGNTHAPTLMIAEKAAAMILRDKQIQAEGSSGDNSRPEQNSAAEFA